VPNVVVGGGSSGGGQQPPPLVVGGVPGPVKKLAEAGIQRARKLIGGKKDEIIATLPDPRVKRRPKVKLPDQDGLVKDFLTRLGPAGIAAGEGGNVVLDVAPMWFADP